MPDDHTPTDEDRERDLLADYEVCDSWCQARALVRGDHIGPIARAAIRRALAAEAELARLRAILDAPRESLYADGREPTPNERHLLNLLTWRHVEAGELRDEVARLQATVQSLADRVAGQAEVLARLAAKGPAR